MKKKTKLQILSILFSLNIIFLIFFIRGIRGFCIIQGGLIETDGVVTRVERRTVSRNNSTKTKYDVYVSYYDEDGNYLENKVDFINGSSSAYEGQSYSVYFQKNNPNKVYTDVIYQSKDVILITGSLIGVSCIIAFFMRGAVIEEIDAYKNKLAALENENSENDQ